MAAAVVQSKLSTANQASMTFASTPAAGNTVVVIGWTWLATQTAPTDNKSNTYNAAVQEANSNGREGVAIWYAYNITSSATFTVNRPGNAVYWQAVEVSGLLTTDPLDTTQSDNTGGSTPTTGTTATLSQADEIAFFVQSTSSGDQTSSTVSAGTEIQEVLGQVDQAGESDYQIVAATTALTRTWTIVGGSVTDSTGAIATFKAAGGGGDPEIALTHGGKLVNGGPLRRGLVR